MTIGSQWVPRSACSNQEGGACGFAQAQAMFVHEAVACFPQGIGVLDLGQQSALSAARSVKFEGSFDKSCLGMPSDASSFNP